jgi:hypothetical protein
MKLFYLSHGIMETNMHDLSIKKNKKRIWQNRKNSSKPISIRIIQELSQEAFVKHT